MTSSEVDVGQLPTGTWNLDRAATTVTVRAKKLGLLSVPATLDVTAATIEIGATGRVTAVDVVVDAGSYGSGNRKRDEHVRSADFLDAERHPHLSFVADDVSPTPEGHRARGSLTVKGKTVPLSLDIDALEHDGKRATFSVSATVDRTAIGVDKLPAFVIGRTLDVEVAATAVMA